MCERRDILKMRQKPESLTQIKNSPLIQVHILLCSKTQTGHAKFTIPNDETNQKLLEQAGHVQRRALNLLRQQV